ncbi:MAG: ATP-dependent zinc protease [Adhaeribacter sp.]
MDEETKKLIGRREMVNFPILQLFEVEAKIDTGAYTSAIHCSNIQEATLADGSRVIRFQLLDPSHPQYNNKLFEFKEFTLRDIKSSFGDVQERYVIRTQIQLYEGIIETDFSLSDRRDLKYPVLIGRALLQNNFIVDVSKKNVALKRKKKANKKKKKNNL